MWKKIPTLGVCLWVCAYEFMHCILCHKSIMCLSEATTSVAPAGIFTQNTLLWLYWEVWCVPGCRTMPPHNLLSITMSYRYKVIHFQLSQRIQVTPTNCENILRRADLQDWAMGFTKVHRIKPVACILLHACTCMYIRFSSSTTTWITLISWCQSLNGQQLCSRVWYGDGGQGELWPD